MNSGAREQSAADCDARRKSYQVSSLSYCKLRERNRRSGSILADEPGERHHSVRLPSESASFPGPLATSVANLDKK
jgi:hypothetical protein